MKAGSAWRTTQVVARRTDGEARIGEESARPFAGQNLRRGTVRFDADRPPRRSLLGRAGLRQLFRPRGSLRLPPSPFSEGSAPRRTPFSLCNSRGYLWISLPCRGFSAKVEW